MYRRTGSGVENVSCQLSHSGHSLSWRGQSGHCHATRWFCIGRADLFSIELLSRKI